MSSLDTQLVGFQGGFFHRTSRDYKFGHRWNLTNLGGWTQPDPIGTPGSSGSGQDNRSGIGGPYSTELNAYNFANNNPCNNTDLTGLLPEGCGAAAAGYVSAIAVTLYTAKKAAEEVAKSPTRRGLRRGAVAAIPLAAATVGGGIATVNFVGKCGPLLTEG